MFSLGLFGRGAEEEKPVSQEAATLDVGALRNYIQINASFKTALELGKYELALYLEGNLSQKIKKKEIDYNEFKRDFYVAYKINEFLEAPDLYASVENPIQSVFDDRYGMTKLLEDSKDAGVAFYAEQEMVKLFRLFKKLLLTVTLPAELPEYVKTGAKFYGWSLSSLGLSSLGYNVSTLHPVIKDLYEQCQKKLAELEKQEKEDPELVK